MTEEVHCCLLRNQPSLKKVLLGPEMRSLGLRLGSATGGSSDGQVEGRVTEASQPFCSGAGGTPCCPQVRRHFVKPGAATTTPTAVLGAGRKGLSPIADKRTRPTKAKCLPSAVSGGQEG